MADRDELLDSMLDSSNTEVEDVVSAADDTESQGVDSKVDASSVLTELQSYDGEITVAELRRLAEAAGEKHTDEELEAMWKAAQAPKPSTPRSYKVYRDENEVPDYDPKEVFAYQAMGKEQRKTVDDLIRLAQFGHYNEARMQQILSERNGMAPKLSEYESRVGEYERKEKLLAYAMNQHIQGNSTPLLQLVELYKKEQNQLPPELTNAPSAEPESSDADDLRTYHEVIVPDAMRLAQKYGANPSELTQEIIRLVQQDQMFMSPERYRQIIEQEIPLTLDRLGYTAAVEAPKVDPKDAELQALKAELASYKAGQKNAALNGAKNRKAPSAGGGVTPSAGDTMPELKSRADMKKYLNS